MKNFLIILIALSFALTGCSNGGGLGGDIKDWELPDSKLKLKVTKDRILEAKDVDWIVEDENGEFINKGKIKKYDYISEIKVGKKSKDVNGKNVDEDLSKRTKNSIHFKVEKDKELLGATEENTTEYIAQFYSGSPFYEEDGEWYQVETATTTIEAYEDQTATTTSEAIIDFIFNTVNADTDNFYTGAGDGHIYAVDYDNPPTQTGWDTIHDTTDTTDCSGGNFGYTVTTAPVGLQKYNGGTGRLYLMRVFLPINTSGLDDSASITSASLYIKPSAVDNYYQDAYDYLAIMQTSQASNTTLALADIDQCGAVNSPTKYSANVDFSALSAETYKEIVLTSTSIVSKTGYTKLGLREGHDIDDNFVGAGSNDSTYRKSLISIYSSEQTGTADDPYLEVTYTTGEPPSAEGNPLTIDTIWFN